MKERPILFNGPMVRAILEGRKTQTRRILKRQPDDFHDTSDRRSYLTNTEILNFEEGSVAQFFYTMGEQEDHLCQYGQPGDRLWVRETWKPDPSFGYPQRTKISEIDQGTNILYRATLPEEHPKYSWQKWKPSIHIPRWASRITLEITDIRVERLNDISDEDAISEGLSSITKDGGITVKYGIPDHDGLPGGDGWPWREWEIDPSFAFSKLWESINGEGSWGCDPWVWVISFKKVEETK